MQHANCSEKHFADLKWKSLKQDLHFKSAKCFSEHLSKLTNVTSDTDKGSQCAELTKRDNEGGVDEY